MGDKTNPSTAEILVRQMRMISSWMPEKVKDFSKEELLYRAGGERAHIIWLLGHVIVGSDIIQYISDGKLQAPKKYRGLFDVGSAPTDKMEDYPPITDIFDVYKSLIEKVNESIQTLNDEELFSPLTGNPSEGLANYFKTRLDLITGTIGHLSYHIGQIYFIMRMLGKEGVG
ncbi:MAG: DinB family protein [Candidatus Zixiibacteriota bacterium]